MNALESTIPILAVALPLLLAALTLWRGRLAATLAPLAALPALLYALFWQPGAGVELPWLLLGTNLGLTEVTRVFLLFTAFLWTVAGSYARSYLGAQSRGFFAFFLLTMAGNLGLVLARDVATFFLFFSLMGFAGYGLVVHDGTAEARWAGKVYLVLVLIGEAMLLPAVLLAVAASGNELADVPAGVASSPYRDLIIALTLGGFGVKAGALLLHVWLPLAHPAAPTPASAVLSGAMIKAGLLGWLLFLPLGEAELEGWATLCVAAGLGAAFYGVLVGLTQRRPKAILAYSSISQMGFMTVGVGAALAAPQALALALSAVSIYAAHHALAKGALFLGVGLPERSHGSLQRALVLGGLALAALALAGAPLTSGAVAKGYLKAAKEPLPAPWPEAIKALFQLGAVGTTLLMGRFLLSVRSPAADKRLALGLWLPWAALLLAGAALVVLLPEDIAEALDLVLSFSAFWPAAVGALLFGAALLAVRRRGRGFGPRIPEGDLLVPAVRLLEFLRHLWATRISPVWVRLRAEVSSRAGGRRGMVGPRRLVEKAELGISYWTALASLFTLLVLALLSVFGLG